MRSCRNLAAFLLCVATFGCAKKNGTADSVAKGRTPLARSSEVGPIKTVVTLEPEKPRLGDRIHLTLEVEAKPGVRVEMPAFGEALGRFAILEFVPRAETRPGGNTIHRQHYELDTPTSGKQRIPSLRIRYSAPEDGGFLEEEALTEQLAIDVASAAPEEEMVELKPLRSALPETLGGLRAHKWWPIPVAVLLLLGAFYAFRVVRLAAARRTRRSAFDVAMQKLASLEARGWPEGTATDGWYVDLSAIVRRYVEDRFSIRAPELTTEEFFREARRALDLRAEHRDLLGAFLLLCDRVKFAAHQPRTEESKAALATARRFLDDTRLQAEPTSAAPNQAAA